MKKYIFISIIGLFILSSQVSAVQRIGNLLFNTSISIALSEDDQIPSDYDVVEIYGATGETFLNKNPQIAHGIDNQIVIIKGMSNINPVILVDGQGLILKSEEIEIGLGDTAMFIYDSGFGTWYQL